MAVFTRQILTARRLITKFGQAVTWQKIEDGTPAEDEPWKPAASVTTDYATTIVFLPEKRTGFEWLSLMSGTEVPAGKLTGIMAAQSSFIPTIKDKVIRDGVALGIRTLDPLAPNGEIVFWQIGFDV